MSKSINAEFEAYVNAELGDIAVVSEGRFISPKIQNYFKIWQHLQAEVESLKTELHHSSLAATAEAHEADRINRELKSLRKDAEWQPIETAPKDGTPLLIFGGIQHPELGNSRTITRATLANWSTSSECWLVLDCDYYGVSIENPTHWMPLPKPPTEIATSAT